MGRRTKRYCPLFEDCIQTSDINLPHVEEVVRKVMGIRSQKEFSEDCGYSTSAISQVLNHKLQKIEPDFAQAIWDSRTENCPVTEEEFLAAFGFIKNPHIEHSDELSLENKRRSFGVQSLQTSDNARNIFQNALLRHKCPVLDMEINYQLRNNLDKKIIIDFRIQTQIPDEHVAEWVVKVVPNSIMDALSFFETLFATLYVQENSSTIMRYSMVVSDRKVFKTLKGVYQDVTVDDYISIILIDAKRQAISDEFILARKNAQENVTSILL